MPVEASTDNPDCGIFISILMSLIVKQLRQCFFFRSPKEDVFYKHFQQFTLNIALMGIDFFFNPLIKSELAKGITEKCLKDISICNNNQTLKFLISILRISFSTVIKILV
jgi:hypothetical protein